MLGVEGSSVTTTTTFPVSVVATPIVTTAATAVVAGGVGLIPLVTATTGDMDPRSLLVPVVPTLNGSNPIINNHSGTTTTTTNNNTVSPNNNNNNNNTSSINSNNPAAMEEEFVKPILKDGEMILEVECGQNKAAMYLSKLCQGSKGPCINFQSSWLTPNEFQFVSGRETAKDWKRSIRHHGKSLKLLLAKGILAVHPTMCDCEGCRIGAVLTRKGEKRRIPNGERKRKSTGNAPENSGSGAFRAVSNGGVTPVKGQDGPSEPKRLTLDHKPQEGGQSPLKESSLMNLPESKDVPILRLPEVLVPDVNKMAVDNRLQGPTLLMPLISPGRVSDITINTGVVATAAIASPVREHKELTPAKPSSDKRRHSSGGQPQNKTNSNNVVASPVAPSEPAVTPDVKVLSSSGGAGGSKADKSVDRLALYQAAVCATRGPDPLCNEQSVEGDSPIKMCDNDGNQSDGSVASSVDSESMDVLSPSKESSKFVFSSPSGDVKAKPAPAVEVCKTEPKDLRTEVQSLKLVTNHSTVSPGKPCEPSSNNSSSASSLSPTKPLLSPSVSATAATSPAASHNKPSPTASIPKRADKEDRHKRPSSALSPPYSKSSITSEHKTIRHPSPVRQPNDTAMKHSPVKSVKDHHHHHNHHHQHHSSEKAHKDRKHESSASSSSSSDKERHASKEKDSSSTPRHNSDRDLDKRRPEERSDKDRKSGVTSAQSIKSEEPSYRSTEYPSSGGSNRGEGGSVPMASAPLSVPPQMADPAAFSEYMRVLAAGHHGLVAPQAGMLQHMFPLRPPTDIPVTASALMHPMHAAACGMFSTPSALLQKDPVLYPTTAGTLPTASYPYGAPGMAPLHLMQPQYPSAASTAMLDYSRSFPYLHWSGGLPMMTSADAIAAAVAASSSAKRSREEMESAAADMNAKRLQLPMAAAYGAASMAPIDYMAAYRGLAANPLSCGMESSMYDKNAEYMRSRLFAGSAVASPSGPKGITSPYLASLPEYYRNLYCCRCMENRPGDIRTWGVEDVVKLVSSLEGCSVYTEIFREQRVDGKILVLLTADHLMKSLGMKLGPAVTLTNRVAKLLLESTQASGCDTCSRLAAMVPSVQSASGY